MTIATLLDMAAEGFGDREAIRTADDRGSGLTYRDLRRAALSAAAELATTTPRPALAYAGPGDAAAAVAMFAAAYAGTTYTPLNHRLPVSALASLVGRVQPVTVVTGTADAAKAAAEAGAPAAEAAEWLRQHLDAGAGAEVEPAADSSAAAVTLFTSGTSAEPKAIRLRHDNLLAYIFGTVEFGAAEADETLLMAVPPFHIAGVSAVLSSVYSGRRIAVLPAFSAHDWLAAASREHVTHAFVVPTMLARIVAALDSDPNLHAPTLRNLAYGGARMPLPVLERALELFPDTAFVNAYGLTETSSTIAVLGPDDHRAAIGAAEGTPQRARLASAGRLVPDIEARILDDTGAELPVGRRGALLLRGPQVAGAGSGAAVRDDGWFDTGDEATLDHDGYLFVHGRGADTIIRGGENIAPGEIEDTLIRHPDIAAACVVGLPDPEWGERIEAAVVRHPGAEIDPEAVIAWLRARLGGLKTPQALHLVDDLPVTPTGKVIRRQVRGRLS